jgi:predicted nuclease of predicted toxin-antitoxin system
VRVKFDEHVTVDAVEVFARFGHDADTVVDEGLTGASDDVLRRAAADAGRVVVTFDVGFADIRLASSGVVLLRLADQQPASVLAVIDRLLTYHRLDEFAGCIVVVTERLVRVRRPEVG